MSEEEADFLKLLEDELDKFNAFFVEKEEEYIITLKVIHIIPLVFLYISIVGSTSLLFHLLSDSIDIALPYFQICWLMIHACNAKQSNGYSNILNLLLEIVVIYI